MGSASWRRIENDAHLNLAYYRDRNKEWVSVSGVAELSRDRAKIRELYEPDWVDKPMPVLLFELAKAWVTKTEPEFGEPHKLDEPHRT